MLPEPESPEPAERWGEFLGLIRLWETLTGHPAPAPLSPNTRGDMRLSPAFAEWLMGLPPAYVTGVAGLSGSRQLQVIGNGAMPRQAHVAYAHLLGREGGSDAAP